MRGPRVRVYIAAPLTDESTHPPVRAAPEPRARPSTAALFLAFLRLGAVSFGGPAMVAYIKRLAVERKGWLREEEFQPGVALCQTLPGATAMQTAAYVGWRVDGLRGALAAFGGFGLPAFVLMLALSIAYRHALQVPAATAMLAGLRALVVALVANATWTFGRASVKQIPDGALALATALLFFVGISPFLIVVAAGLAGAALLRVTPAPPSEARQSRPGWRLAAAPAMLLAFAALFLAVLFLLDRKLALLGLIFMRIDVFAFGGGFASVPLMFRELVETRSWLPESVFLDGIALGQVTPGPIVITATFAGYQIAGLAGATVGTVSIFLPSLFAVVLVEPWFERLRSRVAFRAATRGFVLSFVGLLASVTIQFARLVSWNAASVTLALLALVALLRKVDVVWVVLAGAAVAAMVL
jgi:chromate transporter